MTSFVDRNGYVPSTIGNWSFIAFSIDFGSIISWRKKNEICNENLSICYVEAEEFPSKWAKNEMKFIIG